MSQQSTTQRQRIFTMLHDAWPREVSALQLSRVSLQYASRIYELRKSGVLISNRLERHGDKKFGFYKLGAAPIPSSKQLRARRASADSLFGDLTVERHVDNG